MGKSVLPSFHRFIFEVWPKIRRAVPDARFRIVGTGIDDHLKKMWRSVPGVEPIGFVEDLISEYDTCAFTLVPFRGGGGTKIKVLESLSYGRTCLMYRHINRGLESILRDREAVWLVDDETEIVRDCIHLLTHPDLTVSLGTRGALQVAASYSYNSFEAVVHKTLAATLDRIGRAN
jgi:glycosyltransferase involved in cell wall biosynthesis